MRTHRRVAQHPTSSRPRALPLHLYDLRVASQVLAAEAILPEQFSCTPALTGSGHGVMMLMGAVLEDALTCFEKQFVTNGRRAQRLAREAEEWFFIDDPCWLFSFLNICAVLGLDPTAVRLQLTRWRQSHAAAPQKKKQRLMAVVRPLTIAA